MDSRAVTREICEVILKPLASIGFDRRTSRSAWRQRGEHVEVVNFQSFNAYLADTIGCTTFSFAVKLGLWPLYIPPRDSLKTDAGRVLPAEYQCPIRRHLQKRLKQIDLPRKDIWLVERDGSNLTRAVADAAAVLREDGLAWFDALRTPEAVAVLLEDHDEDMDGTWGFGRKGSPHRIYLQACTRMRLGTFGTDEVAWLEQFATYERELMNALSKPKRNRPTPPNLPA